MIALIADNRDAIAALCKEFGMRKLDLFGSAATGKFDPETSDVDFVVDPGGYERGAARRYLDFISAMEDLLGRRVDMITEDSISNPYFREAVDEQRVTIYEAGHGEAAA
jgi:predicted nucleotidyltransferase